MRKVKSSTRAKLRKIANKRIGQKRTTGEFKRIASAVGKKLGKQAGEKIAGAMYWKKAHKMEQMKKRMYS